MEIGILIVVILTMILAISSIVISFILYKKNKTEVIDQDKMTNNIKNQITEDLSSQFVKFNKNVDEKIGNSFNMINKNFSDLREEIDKKMKSFDDLVIKEVQIIKGAIDEKFENEVAKKMEENFKNIKENMENLDKNLVRFETLQDSVNSLQKTFDGTKSRGNYGEFNLKSILNEHLSKDLWAAQVDLKKIAKKGLDEAAAVDFEDMNPNSERVDFVIKMPNGEANSQNDRYLPIDCKFPLDPFNAYQDADSKEERIKAQINFRKVILEQAKSIKSKYIIKNVTTKQAIMYLPSEAIFALAVSDNELVSALNKDHDIMLAGPSTILMIIQTIAYANYGINIKQNIDILLDAFLFIRQSEDNIYTKIEQSIKKNNKTGVELNRALKIVDRVKKRIQNSIDSARKKGIIKEDYDIDKVAMNMPMIEDLSDENDDKEEE